MTFRLRAAVIAVAGAILGCARPSPPSGGVRDVRGPVVIATDPAPNSTIQDANTVIRFRFNERISERARQGTIDDAVLVSPRTGRVNVKHGSEELEVRVDGGLRPGLVYRFTVLPLVADLFGNAMREPFELVVSTGALLAENALAGQVLDRVTGRPVPNADVVLLPPAPVADTVIYATRTDQQGLYAFRYVPADRYNMVAFTDRNRSLLPDLLTEASGMRPVLMSPRDTILADIAILEPDTSRAQLIRAEVVDSVTLRLAFSDFLAPDSQTIAQVGVAFEPPEGKAPPSVTGVLHPTTWQAQQAQQDSVRRRAAAPAAQQQPASRVPTGGGVLAAPGQERGGLPRGVPLPLQELIVLLGAPLETGVAYKVTATGVVNINLRPFGGGTVNVTRAAPPARAGAPAAQPGAPADSARAPAANPPNPAPAAPDSTRAPTPAPQ